MKLLLITFLSLFTLLSCSKKANDFSSTATITTVFPLQAYQEDYKQMVELLVEKHPKPYAFISEDSLSILIEDQYNKINDSISLGRFIWICEKVVAAVQCGHSAVWTGQLQNLPKAMRFPMNVRFHKEKLYIMDAKTNADKLEAGDEILSINGVDIATLQKAIFTHLPSEGCNRAIQAEIANDFFTQFCAMYFNFPTSFTVKVKHKEEMGEIHLAQATEFHPTKTFLDKGDKPLCFDTDLENSTTTLTIRSFEYYKKQLPIFKSFVDSCFLNIHENQIQNLIIDVRDNGGGDPFCSSYLLGYIADKPYTYFDKDIAWWYRKLKKPIQSKANRFKNKPYILVNGKCLSTTGHFCSLVKENDWGIIVGEETGATYTCNDFSKFYNFDNTNAFLRVATREVKTTVTTLSNKQGIIPDHHVTTNIEHYLNNTDTVLNYTLNLIEEKRLISKK